MKTHEELTVASEADIKFYNKCIKGLPARPEGSDIPYGSEAHIVQHMRTAIDYVKPYSILEIGLNLGWGAAIMLNLFEGKVFSVDISDRNEAIEAGAALGYWYKNRFEFLIWDSHDAYKFLRNKDFNMAFIDGNHEEEDVVKDIQLCTKLNIEHILFDDIYERYGPGVMKAINRFPKQLTLIKDMDNMRLYKNNIYE